MPRGISMLSCSIRFYTQEIKKASDGGFGKTATNLCLMGHKVAFKHADAFLNACNIRR